MTPERWQRIKTLFAAALEVPESERAGLLALESNGDAALIEEVVSLLASHEATGDFLESPAPEMSASVYAALDDHVGERIGAYRIVGTLGTGGMGDVFRAVRDDDQYRAEVAIKLMRADVRDNLAEQRFKNERQILAKLDHRNIARLLDGGATPGGVPYVVMELIQGEPIDQFCDAQDLPVRDRVQLFLQVCAAVSYAHQHLVVHRDLKPNNILVTADGSVKLLDFGIAKLLEANSIAGTTSDETRTQLRAMTIDYASPEQVSGGTVTTVSDVYSLGVVLYRLITGQSPYGKRTNDAQRVAEILSDTIPTRPSQVQLGERRARDIDADLDNILLMALRKEPQKRYGSVEQFANDLRNFLGGMPVAARGNAWRYRLGKFVRRRKVEIAAAGLVLASLVGGLGFAIREARIAEQQRALAQRHFDSVRKLANALLSDVYDEIDALPGAQQARINLARVSGEYLEKLSSEPGGDTELKVGLANAWRKIGDIHGGTNSPGGGDTKLAVESYEKSIKLLEEVVAAEPDNQRAGATLAKSLIMQAKTVLFVQGQEPALAYAERAAKVAEANPEGFSGEHDRFNVLMVSNHSLCEILSALERPAEAMAMCDKAIAVAEAYASTKPDDVPALKLLRNAYTNVAIVVDTRLSEAEALERTLSLMRKSLLVSEKLMAMEPESAEHITRLAEQRLNLGDAYFNGGKFPEAIATYRLAAPVLAKAAEEKTDARAQLAAGMNDLGLAASLVKVGEPRSAMPLFDSAERVFAEMLRADPENVMNGFMLAQAEIRRGEMYALLAEKPGNPDARRANWKKALAALEPGVARMQSVNERYPLSGTEKIPLDVGIEALARAQTAIAQL